MLDMRMYELFFVNLNRCITVTYQDSSIYRITS